MTITRAYKTELDLTNKQKTACLEHAGCARFAYNWGLNQKQEAYKRQEKIPTAIELHRRLNKLKKTTFPFFYRVSKCAPQEALRNLDRAYRNFYHGLRRKEKGNYKGKPGLPHYKKKTRDRGSFRLTGSIRVNSGSVQLPRLGRLRLKEKNYLPTTGVHILHATVSMQAGRFYVSVQVEEEITRPEQTGSPVGLDLGITELATVSDGTIYENPRPLKRVLRKLRKLGKTVSRRKKDSRNRHKACDKLARLHARIVNIRQDTLHKLTTTVCKSHAYIAIEDLNVSAMMHNRHLSQALADASFGEIRRQLTYKAAWYGARLVVIGRYFPSSKTCAVCGYIMPELPLHVRQWLCPSCATVHKRDLNAAKTVLLAASSAESLNVCGAEGSGLPDRASETMPCVKQKPNNVY